MFVDLDVVRRAGLIQNSLRSKHYRRLPDGNRFLFIPHYVLGEAGAIVDSTLDKESRAVQAS
jgi:hypothetical protein